MSPPETRSPQFEPLPLPGLRLFRPRLNRDERGTFVKTYYEPSFVNEGVEFETRESFYSTTSCGVIRGMHFQVPDQAHAKLVSCLQGRILDVVVDLRRDLPTYGRHCSVVMDASNPAVLFIPVGFAHGFLALEGDSLVHYQTTQPYSPDHDCGIRWDSFGCDWAEPNPVVSARDRGFPTLAQFESPFRAT